MFKEVRRPQLPLVRDLVSAVLHPTLLAMTELNGAVLPAVAGVGSAEEDDSAGGARFHSPQVNTTPVAIAQMCIFNKTAGKRKVHTAGKRKLVQQYSSTAVHTRMTPSK